MPEPRPEPSPSPLANRKRNPWTMVRSFSLVLIFLVGTGLVAHYARLAARLEDEVKQQAQEIDQQHTLIQQSKAETETERLTARRHLYAAQMNLAQRAWDEHQVQRVRALLEDQQPKAGEIDLRGLEWHYWNRRCNPDLLILKGFTRLAFSANGRFLARIGEQNKSEVWDLSLRKVVHAFWGSYDLHAVSADGKRLATAHEREVTVWDAETGKRVRSFEVEFKGRVTLSPDGKRLALPTRDAIKLFAIDTGKELFTIKEAGHDELVFSPDGKRLAAPRWDDKARTWSGGTIWNAETGTPLTTLTGGCRPLVFSPDGNSLAACDSESVRILDAATGKVERKLDGPLTPLAIAFSADGKGLAAGGSQGRVTIWNAQTGKLFLTLNHLTAQREDGSHRAIERLAFFANGRLLAVADDDGTVRIREVAPQGESPSLPSENSFTSGFGGPFECAVSGDGTRLAVVSNASSSRIHELFSEAEHSVKVWDLVRGQCQGMVFDISMGVTMSPEGGRLAVVRKGERGDWTRLRLLDVSTRRWLSTLDGHTDTITDQVFSDDGKQLASASRDRTVRLWDTSTGKELFVFKGHGGTVRRVRFSAAGKQITSIGESDRGQELKVWDTQTGKELASVSGPQGNPGSFSTDGQRVASFKDNEALVWEAATGKVLLTLRGHTKKIHTALFSPDGKRLVTVCGQMGKVWDTQSGHELLTLKDLGAPLIFTPNGKQLVSADSSPVNIWEVGEWHEEEKQARWLTLTRDSIPLSFDWTTPTQRIIAHLDTKEWDRALVELNHAIEHQMASPWYWQVRGHLHARQDQWDKAGADFARAVAENPDDWRTWAGSIHAQLKRGDLEGYRRACADMLEHSREIRKELGMNASLSWLHGNANPLVWQCVLAPGAVAKPDEVVQLAQNAVAIRGRGRQSASLLTALGAAHYRAGQFEAAIKQLQKAIDTERKGSHLDFPYIFPVFLKADDEGAGVHDCLFLAMAHQRLGQTKEAQRWLDKATSALTQSLPPEPESWAERVELELLRKEADELVKGSGKKPQTPKHP